MKKKEEEKLWCMSNLIHLKFFLFFPFLFRNVIFLLQVNIPSLGIFSIESIFLLRTICINNYYGTMVVIWRMIARGICDKMRKKMLINFSIWNYNLILLEGMSSGYRIMFLCTTEEKWAKEWSNKFLILNYVTAHILLLHIPWKTILCIMCRRSVSNDALPLRRWIFHSFSPRFHPSRKWIFAYK